MELHRQHITGSVATSKQDAALWVQTPSVEHLSSTQTAVAKVAQRQSSHNKHINMLPTGTACCYCCGHSPCALSGTGCQSTTQCRPFAIQARWLSGSATTSTTCSLLGCLNQGLGPFPCLLRCNMPTAMPTAGIRAVLHHTVRHALQRLH